MSAFVNAFMNVDMSELWKRLGVRTVGPLLEHQVLDEVREAGLPRRILARAHLVADVDLHELGRLIRHDHEPQAIFLEPAAHLAVLEHDLRR
jgi:hypothetical protein